MTAKTVLTCFNCGRTEDVHTYSFDMDLPTLTGCKMCVFAVSMGDDELLKAMRPRRKKRNPR